MAGHPAAIALRISARRARMASEAAAAAAASPLSAVLVRPRSSVIRSIATRIASAAVLTSAAAPVAR